MHQAMRPRNQYKRASNPFSSVGYLDEGQLEQARKLVEEGYQNVDIANMLGVDVQRVWKTLGDKGYRGQHQTNKGVVGGI